jgi:hypothetical protein
MDIRNIPKYKSSLPTTGVSLLTTLPNFLASIKFPTLIVADKVIKIFGNMNHATRIPNERKGLSFGRSYIGVFIMVYS